MNYFQCLTVALLISALATAHADQYTCETGIVSKDARTAAPSYSTVGIIANKSRSTCDFEVADEKIDRNASASTRGDSNSSGSSSDSNAAKSKMAQGAFAAARQDSFAKYRSAQAIGIFAPLLFGTTVFPKEIIDRFGERELLSGLRACFDETGTNYREINSIRSGNSYFRCGLSGIKRRLDVDMVSASIGDSPKVFISFKMSDTETEQRVVFLPRPL